MKDKPATTVRIGDGFTAEQQRRAVRMDAGDSDKHIAWLTKLMAGAHRKLGWPIFWDEPGKCYVMQFGNIGKRPYHMGCAVRWTVDGLEQWVLSLFPLPKGMRWAPMGMLD